MPPIALLDANVIWAAALRDTLLRAAGEDLFRPVWSAEILDELARTLKERRPHLDPAAIDRTVQRMCQAFPDAMVAGYRHRVSNPPFTPIQVLQTLGRSVPRFAELARASFLA